MCEQACDNVFLYFYFFTFETGFELATTRTTVRGSHQWATGVWDNTTVPEEWAPDNGYEHSMDAFHALQEFSKLNEYEQSLVRMRTEGYTFDEIAKDINSKPGAKRKSLNNIRDEIMDINERLVSEIGE